MRFIAARTSATRVELEHRGLEALGDQADAVRGILDSPRGWAGLLDRFGATVVDAAHPEPPARPYQRARSSRVNSFEAAGASGSRLVG